MTNQAANTNWAERTSLGGCIVKVSPTVITSFSSLPTDFRNVGMIDVSDLLEVNVERQELEYRSGTPSQTQKISYIQQNAGVNFNCAEFDFQNFAWALGETPSYTLGSFSDLVQATPTPTATVFAVSDASDLTAYDLLEIDLGTGGTADKHYRYLSSKSSNTLTLTEALKEAPAGNDTVKNVIQVDIDYGETVSPNYYSLKIEKTLTSIGKTLNIYFPKVQATGNFSFNFQDDNMNKLPFSFKGVSNDTGKLFKASFDFS
jgi:hypothetical protein